MKFQIILSTELKGAPVKLSESYHDATFKMPGSSSCVIYGAKTKSCCCGCGMDLKDVFHVCPTSSEIVYGRCMIFEMKFEYLKVMNTFGLSNYFSNT